MIQEFNVRSETIRPWVLGCTLVANLQLQTFEPAQIEEFFPPEPDRPSVPISFCDICLSCFVKLNNWSTSRGFIPRHPHPW